MWLLERTTNTPRTSAGMSTSGTTKASAFTPGSAAPLSRTCGTRPARLAILLPRMHAIAMIEHCPSGALTYQLDGVTNEPLFPQAISVVNDGPLWVTAMVPITNSDGTVLETRNRVTLCRCGDSANKPLCDGSHKEAGFTEP